MTRAIPSWADALGGRRSRLPVRGRACGPGRAAAQLRGAVRRRRVLRLSVVSRRAVQFGVEAERRDRAPAARMVACGALAGEVRLLRLRRLHGGRRWCGGLGAARARRAARVPLEPPAVESLARDVPAVVECGV